jgi:hypothetical protein
MRRRTSGVAWSYCSTQDVANPSTASDRVPVGRPNNIGTIRMGSDPGLALVERVTNGIDSLLELGVLLDGATSVATPEEAARRLWGVPVGGLAEMTESERRRLGENLLVSLHESGDGKRPSIRIQDAGVGQHPSDFHSTLLSLNESNKVGKPYTMGTYGQGGSVTFGFSEWTVIASRRHPRLLAAGQRDVVGWTVVFEEETDPSKNILPRYVWLVRSDGSPLELAPTCLPKLEFGTRITHVKYDVQQLRGPFTTQMWQFLHATLFDPVLPFLLSGDRRGDPKKAGGEMDSRVIIGNAARLRNIDRARGDLRLAAADTHQLMLGSGYGTVEVSWWALSRPEGSASKSDAAAGYVQANNAVSITLHGQRQDAEARTWIKDKAHLPFLYKNMVVSVNANGLTPTGRRELFASTRERATESELRKLIYEQVADLIRTDDDLRRLNYEEKEKLLRRSTAAANEKVRKRLGKFIKTKLKGTVAPGSTGKGSGPGGAPSAGGTRHGPDRGKPKGGTGTGPGREIDDAHLPNVPTYVKFEGQRLRIAHGASGYAWVLIDAKNGFLPEHADALTITFAGHPADRLTIRSQSRLLGGKSRWAVRAAPDCPVGEAKVEVQLMTSRGLLVASLPIEVVEPPEPDKSGQSGQGEDTGPDVRWIYRGDWENHGMNAHTVGTVDEDDESTIIWVNRNFGLLDRALGSSKLTADQIQTRADRYQFPVACGLWLQHHDLKTAYPKPDESYLRSELERLAEAVLVAMDPDVELAGAEELD